MISTRTKVSALVALSFLTLASPVFAQAGWKQPPKNVVDILDAPPTPRVQVSPDGTRALLVSYDPYPPLEMLARPFLKLAGIRIDPALNSRQRTMRNRSIEILEFETGKRTKVDLPKDASINSVRWSPDGVHFAFTNDVADGVELWVGDAKAGKAQRVPKIRLNDVLGAPFSWHAVNASLFLRAVPAGRGPAPQASRVPDGPVVEETAGKVSKMMTFQDLLKNPADEAAFEYYGTCQIVVLPLSGMDDADSAPKIGKPDLYESIDPAPEGPAHLLVTRLKKPFSYRVPSARFAQVTVVWDMNGKVERVIADLPVADEIPPQGVRTGPRGVEWQPGAPATLVWAEALDGGDPLKKAPHRDRLMTLAAPFTGEPREIMKVKHRFSGIDWTGRPNEVFLTEFDRDRRWTTTYLADLTAPDAPAVLVDRSVNDAYKDPGNPIQEERTDGARVMVRDGAFVFLAGAGASESGDRPFLDQLDLTTKKVQRIWQSAESGYETFSHFVGAPAPNARRILIRNESRTEPPNWFIENLSDGQRTKVTDFKDPAPELTKVRKELLKYKRADGCQLTGTLYLPPDYQEGTRLPLIVWAYPLEYSDAGTAGQVRGSTKTFTRLAGDSPLFFLLNGYAVLMDATMPVIGDPEKMNDTFVEQIVSSAQAAVDKVASMGVADPNRCCVSGHSYGAFMTANLLAHSDIFAAGIARSGAYNRTLTPFGFQSERRSYWEATDLYTRMSPFTYANKINEPLLMIHGDADNNPGTHTIQSERLFQAIRGNGGTARLVLLPYEAHGYRARENILQVLAEMFEWADKYVKNRQVPQR